MLLKYIEFAFNKGLSASTITSQLSAVSYIHKLANVSDPAQSFIIKKMLKGVQNLRPQIDIRLPFNINHVSSMIESMVKISSSPYIRALFNAMYSLAFHALLRVGEFTSSLPLPPTSFSFNISIRTLVPNNCRLLFSTTNIVRVILQSRS